MKGKIFNAQEVQSILNGSKVMFRVVCKKQPKENLGYIREASITGNGYYFPFGKPKFQVGETIFVKESFSKLLIHSGHQYYYPAHCIRECVDRDNGFHYWADGNPEFGDWESPRPATHMKQEYSRLFLKIKSVKVERLQDISEEDCYKSGVECLGGSQIADTGDYFESEYYFGELEERIRECGCDATIEHCDKCVYDFRSPYANTYDNPFEPFIEFWNSTHKKPEEKWEANPWVFVYKYEVIKNN